MKATHLFTAFVLVVLVVACNVKGSNQLNGTWQKENSSDTITFSPGAKVKVVSGQTTIASEYRVSGSDTIQISLGMLGTGNLKYALSSDVLTLTDASGHASKFKKVQEKTEQAKTKPEQAAQKPAETAHKAHQ